LSSLLFFLIFREHALYGTWKPAELLALTLNGGDTGELAALPLGKGDPAVGEGEEGIIPSAAYVFPGVNFGAPLTHDNGSRLDRCPRRGLYT
jgi:hypothetical protein